MNRENSVATPGRATKRGRTRHAIVMVMAVGVAACGQKGPLTLAKPVPPAAAASTAASR